MGRFDRTLEFIARLQGAHTIKTVNATLSSLIQPFGLSYFIAAIVPGDGRLPKSRRQFQSQILFSTWPKEWQARYERSGYVHIDPVAQRFCADATPFRWSDESVRSLILTPDAAIIMEEARSFGLRDGLGFMVDSLDGRRVAVSFAGENADLSSAERSVLNLISVYAVGKAMEILDGENTISSLDVFGLTLREVECLNWASHGKSEWEIGQILAISEHTAEKHLANAKVKLRAATCAQAVSVAMRLGLIR